MPYSNSKLGKAWQGDVKRNQASILYWAFKVNTLASQVTEEAIRVTLDSSLGGVLEEINENNKRENEDGK
jgi:hypothetical protein